MNTKISTPYVPISWGELIDKITILEIKKLKITSAEARANVKKELKLLSDIVEIEKNEVAFNPLKNELADINLQLWEVEDKIREKELNNQFDDFFIELARSVYKLNDNRAKIKKAINLLLQSELVEEKSYQQYKITSYGRGNV